MRALAGTVSALSLAAVAAGLVLIRSDYQGARDLPEVQGRPPAIQRELDRREEERQAAKRTVQAEIARWEREAGDAVARERAEHKDNPFVRAGERRQVEDWRLSGGHYDHLSAGLWTPAFEAQGQEFWTPWFFFQSDRGGNVKELEIAYRYKSPMKHVTDGPVEWAIRSSFAGKKKLTYEIAIDCLKTCTAGWRRYEIELTGPGTTRVQSRLWAYRAGLAKVISLE